MDGQLVSQVTAARHTQSLHYTFSPMSAVVQISLSARVDYDEYAVPVSIGMAVLTRLRTADGRYINLGENGNASTGSANQLTEVEGLLFADNCYTLAIINWFI